MFSNHVGEVRTSRAWHLVMRLFKFGRPSEGKLREAFTYILLSRNAWLDLRDQTTVHSSRAGKPAAFILFSYQFRRCISSFPSAFFAFTSVILK